MKKESRADKKFRETQEEFRLRTQAEPLLLMVSVIRHTISEEAKVLETQLSALGLSVQERNNIYKALSLRRVRMEAELYEPHAYEQVRAQAQALGLLDRPTDPALGNSPVERGA